ERDLQILAGDRALIDQDLTERSLQRRVRQPGDFGDAARSSEAADDGDDVVRRLRNGVAAAAVTARVAELPAHVHREIARGSAPRQRIGDARELAEQPAHRLVAKVAIASERLRTDAIDARRNFG